jgi:neutral ceramidase
MHRRALLAALAALAGTPFARAIGQRVDDTSGRRRDLRRSVWKAGVATIDITPRDSLWMAGFAARTAPSQGTALPLHAKALALEDERGQHSVLVTLDLLGVTHRIAKSVADAVHDRHGLPRARLLLNASHTHCGPVIDDMLSIAYDLSADQRAAIAAYSRDLELRLARVVGQALETRRPARLSWGQGEAAFAANRRVQFTPDGPVDHTVPVLRVDAIASPAVPLALVFGYACHNTTLQANFTQFHGDYAGVAQAVLERRHPGVTAMFMSGCGADANPKPRGTLALVDQHGTALADAVDRALPTLRPMLADTLSTEYETVDLPFAPTPDRAGWIARLQDSDQYIRRHAQLMLDVLDREGTLPAVQPEPLQVWTFGRDLTLIALGGEVVVDYVLRLRRDYPDRHLWVAGYSNDVFGYVPSSRVLKEGGYEGGDAMIYYGRPGPFAPPVEELIHDALRRMLAKSR